MQTQVPKSSTRMTVAPLYVNGITIALQAEIRLADLQRLIAIGEYMRQLLEYRRLTQYLGTREARLEDYPTVRRLARWRVDCQPFRVLIAGF